MSEGELVLFTVEGLNPRDPKDQTKIAERLKQIVDQLNEADRKFVSEMMIFLALDPFDDSKDASSGIFATSSIVRDSETGGGSSEELDGEERSSSDGDADS